MAAMSTTPPKTTPRTYESLFSAFPSTFTQISPAIDPDDDDDDGDGDEDPRRRERLPMTRSPRTRFESRHKGLHDPFMLHLSAPERAAAASSNHTRLALSDQLPGHSRLPEPKSIATFLSRPKDGLGSPSSPSSPILGDLHGDLHGAQSSPSLSPPSTLSPSALTLSSISAPTLSPIASPSPSSSPVRQSPVRNVLHHPIPSCLFSAAMARGTPDSSSSPSPSSDLDSAARDTKSRPRSESLYRSGEEHSARTRSRSNPPMPLVAPDSPYPACSSISAGATCSTQDRLATSPTSSSSGSACACSNCMPGQFAEHPYGEHPSRTLFVRNINSNVEDEELKALFSPFGEIRSTYSQCKHRGFVMISYYDIRHANLAMRSLQGKVVRRRKLDIHYSIPKENPPEKDLNQGTLVVFNLDPQTKNDELLVIFGQYGQIKEIRETPNKKHHKFIEFYDVRHAEEAMKRLNKTEVRGKKIKIESSRPGGVRRVRGVATPGTQAGQKFSASSTLNPDSEAFSPPIPSSVPGQSPPFVEHAHIPYPSVPIHFSSPPSVAPAPELTAGYSYPVDIAQPHSYPYPLYSSAYMQWPGQEPYYQQQS